MPAILYYIPLDEACTACNPAASGALGVRIYTCFVVVVHQSLGW